MMRTLVSCILLACVLSASARAVLSGRVSDTSGAAVEAMVTILESGRMAGYGRADEAGLYSVTYTGTADSITVRCAAIGYGTVIKQIPARTCTLDFILTLGYALKEVTVVADKITQRGDTLSFNVAAYRSDADRVIADVIKKMPGLEVADNGKILFNGKAIKNFYVEDMDLLQGRYGIATNNVSASDVASVQVYQNHQPVRALKDLNPSADVAINLRLKSSARGIWSATGMVGGGYKPALWAAEATAMYFGRHMQNITTYKGNNSGTDINAQLSNLTDDVPMSFYNSAPLSVALPAIPGIASKRYIRNRSNALSTNNIIRLDSLTSLSVALTYTDDLLRRSGESVSRQYVPSTADYRTITGIVTARSYVHSLSASSTYKKNTSALYIANQLELKADWNRDDGTALTSSSFTSGASEIGQRLDNPSFEISDCVTVIRSSGAQITAAAGWNHHPQQLTVSPSDYLGIEATAPSLRQDYTTDNIKASLMSGLFRRLGRVNVNMLLLADADIEKVTSQLYGLEVPASASAANDYLFGQLSMGIEPRFDYLLGKVYFQLRLPLGYNRQWISDSRDASYSRSWNYPDFNPALTLRYATGRHTLSAEAAYQCMRNNSPRAARGIIMTQYLSFRQADIERTMIDRNVSAQLSYRVANPMIQLFGNASLAYTRFYHNTIAAVDYDGLSTVSIALPRSYTSDRYSASASVNKGVGFWDSTVKLSGSASLYRSSRLIGGDLFGYSTTYWSGNVLLTSTPARWMGAAMAFAYGSNRSYTDFDRSATHPVHQWTCRIDMNFYPAHNLILNVAAEDNYTNLTSLDRHVWFGDAKVTYRYRRLDWELELNNLFNRRIFTRVQYTDMDIYTSTYTLRPRSIMLRLRFKLL
ncbi:MAG: TonB-dependent receptor [Muribaculaceae bacterium]|nr:TonB-dependent receptor [Muribaculaceae bacterium]